MLLAAPAGYGKSVLLGQWHHGARRRPIAWLTADERDHDPVRFGRHLVESLDAAVPGLGRRAGLQLGPGSTGLGDRVVDLLLDDLSGLSTDLVVVLEDVDRIGGGRVTGDLARLITEAPSRVHFVVATRSDPGVPVHRLRSTGQLVELRAADLAFSPDETVELVRALSGHEPGADVADHLVRLTEGWPVAVQLAALSLGDTPGDGALARFDPTDRGIVDYLSAELLDQLEPEVLSFLLDVSVLHELDPALCNHVTGRGDSAEILAGLHQSALFVLPADGGSGRYRLHRLVGELLRQDLATADPDRPARLRERAAAWCLGRGDPGQAAEYLVDARSWDRCLEVVDEHARAFCDDGHVDTVLGWVRAMPRAVHRRHTRLRLTEAALLVVACRPESAAAVLADIERDGDLTVGEQVVADAIWCGLAEVAGPGPDTLARQERSLAALAALPPDPIDRVPHVLGGSDPVDLACLLRFTGAKARLLLGAEGALDRAEAATRTPPSTDIACQVEALGSLALTEALAHRPAARATAHRACALAADHLAAAHPALIPAELGLAVAARDRGDLAAADAFGDAALARAVRWRRWPMVGLALTERALVELARGRPDQALSWLDRRTTMGGAPLAPMAAGRFLAVERRAWAALGDRGGPVAVEGPGASWDRALTEVALAAESGDAAGARKALEAWPRACAPLGELEHELASALVAHGEGGAAAARSGVRRLLAGTARNGLVGAFVVAGRAAIPLLTDAAQAHPARHADVVLAAVRRSVGLGPDLVEPLTDREVEVLRLLPSRLSNADMGRALFVSTNTIKTHLKHIYQKLDAADRDAAIRRARELSLL